MVVHPMPFSNGSREPRDDELGRKDPGVVLPLIAPLRDLLRAELAGERVDLSKGSLVDGLKWNTRTGL
jgi:hypothetical protein